MINLEQRITEAFNSFTGKNPEILGKYYAPDIVFKDPVVEIKGLKDLTTYYTHTYQNVISIHFDFLHFSILENECYARWIMTIAVKHLNNNKPYKVEGMCHLKVNQNGLVEYHRDYVDMGSMVYEKLPLLGTIIRFIKNKLRGDL